MIKLFDECYIREDAVSKIALIKQLPNSNQVTLHDQKSAYETVTLANKRRIVNEFTHPAFVHVSSQFQTKLGGFDYQDCLVNTNELLGAFLKDDGHFTFTIQLIYKDIKYILQYGDFEYRREMFNRLIGVEE